MIVEHLQGDIACQDEMIRMSAFTTLPAHIQANLLYFVGVGNILRDRQREIGVNRLQQAAVLAPKDFKIRLALGLSRFGRLPLAAMVEPRRALGGLFRKKAMRMPIGQDLSMR
jgi:hypothetical protein